MIVTTMLTLARQRVNSPMRMILAVAFFGFGVIGVLFTGSIGGLARGQMSAFAFLAAAGLIGQEVSSGVLTLAFARPMRRAEWVVGRWLGASAVAAALIVLQVLVATAVSVMRHGDPTFQLVALKLLDGVLASVGLCAVLTMFSSLVPGLGDLGLLLLGTFLGGGLSAAGMHYQISWIARAGTEVQSFLNVGLDPAPFFGQGAISWFAVVSYFSTLAICLVVAIHAVNRKELSYASG